MRVAAFFHAGGGCPLAAQILAANGAAPPMAVAPGARAVALSMLWMVRRRLRRGQRRRLTA